MAGDLDAATKRTANKIKDIGTGVQQNQNVELSDTEIQEEIGAAVSQYSLDRPLVLVKDITGITSPFIATSSLTGWVDDWSRLLAIEIQAAAVSASYIPQYLDVDETVEEYRDATTRY